MEDNEHDQLAELRRIKEDYVDGNLKWYTDHTTWPRIVFRVAGTLVIVVSLAIPFIAAAGGNLLKYGVPTAALAIALISALNAFYGWQKTWEKRITVQLTLEGLIAVWQTQMDAATRLGDESERYEAARSATERLIDATRALTVSETNTWFTSVKFPDTPAQPTGNKNMANKAPAAKT